MKRHLFQQHANHTALRSAKAILVRHTVSGLPSSLPARAQNVSAPALLQFYEARWDTIEDRMVDVFAAGYGAMWLPPPSRADSGGLSVGYDIFDRFDLGKAGNETLYGTERYFKKMVEMGHKAGVNSYADFILNHNGFSDANRPGFIAEGDYPGFVLELPGDINGDFHAKLLDCGVDEELCRLSGLIDIDHAKTTNSFAIRSKLAIR